MATVNIINQSPHALPEYATAGSSGLDIRAHLPEPLLLQPLERQLVPTGIFLEIPDGYECQVRPRSGLAFRQGITCLNSPGTVDADYRGEIKVLLINLSDQPQTIQSGDRIAQLVFQAVEKITWQPVGQLKDSDRGAGGWGSTGKQ